MTKKPLKILTVAALLVVWLVPFEAQGAPMDGAGFVESREGKIEATGLTAVFPEDYICEPISSPFASPFRYDGSRRRDDRHGGLHGGMNLTLEEGTPLLAVASGKVIAKGVGGRLEGIYLWLMHAPSDTGVPFWIYTKYQHLSEMPALNEGDAVHIGQVIALSGKTGTTGGHYKSAGYPHLHMSVYMGPSNEYVKTGIYGSIIKALDAKLSDPLIIYLPQIKDLTSIASLPEDRKRVNIPIVSDNGSIHPQGSKVVWPVRCKHKGKN
jgi:murein DD-endopeptidase MepM/ murein hydrolase activator NlpD